MKQQHNKHGTHGYKKPCSLTYQDIVTYQDLVKYNLCFKSYGKAIKISSKHLGLLLDLLVPFTFGMFTLFLVRFWYRCIIFRF